MDHKKIGHEKFSFKTRSAWQSYSIPQRTSNWSPTHLVSSAGGYGNWPNENKTKCFELPLTHIKWTSYYALIPMGLAVLGILLTLFVFITFIKHHETPIVKASGEPNVFSLSTWHGLLSRLYCSRLILSRVDLCSSGFLLVSIEILRRHYRWCQGNWFIWRLSEGEFGISPNYCQSMAGSHKLRP